jgi:hypothetical protein
VAAIIYPPPRPRDAAAAGAGAPIASQGASGANSRNVPFVIREIFGVAVVVSGRLVGPAVVSEIVLAPGATNQTPFPCLQLYVSDDNGGGGSNQALGTVVQGEQIYDTFMFARDDGVVNQETNGFPIFDMTEATVGFMVLPVRRATYKSSFFLKMKLSTNVPSGTFVMGSIRVIENIPADQVGNFL